MNNLSEYISEKFKISKDIKVVSNDIKILEYISKLCSIKADKPINIIRKWIIDNDVKIIDEYHLEDREYLKYIYKNVHNIGQDILNKSYNFLEHRYGVSFGDFMKRFYEYFTRDAKIQDDATKYDNFKLQILVVEKALCIIGGEIKFIFIKKETI